MTTNDKINAFIADFKQKGGCFAVPISTLNDRTRPSLDEENIVWLQHRLEALVREEGEEEKTVDEHDAEMTTEELEAEGEWSELEQSFEIEMQKYGNQ